MTEGGRNRRRDGGKGGLREELLEKEGGEHRKEGSGRRTEKRKGGKA